MSNGTEKLYQTNQIDSTPYVDRDYEYQRQNFYNLVERGQDAIQGILDLAGGGAWALISSTDLSSAASFNFTAVDASAYDGYMMYLMNVIPANDEVFLWVRTSTNGGSSYDSGSANYSNDI